MHPSELLSNPSPILCTHGFEMYTHGKKLWPLHQNIHNYCEQGSRLYDIKNQVYSFQITTEVLLFK
jgi:hypothetical protein